MQPGQLGIRLIIISLLHFRFMDKVPVLFGTINRMLYINRDPNAEACGQSR